MIFCEKTLIVVLHDKGLIHVQYIPFPRTVVYATFQIITNYEQDNAASPSVSIPELTRRHHKVNKALSAVKLFTPAISSFIAAHYKIICTPDYRGRVKRTENLLLSSR